MEKSFTGAELVKALSEGKLKELIVKEGMVKQDENDPNAILFSEGTLCESWTKIPADMIERAEHLTTVRCHDHEHPYVRLYLEEPPSENTTAGVFADLLKHSARQQPKVQLASRLAGGPLGLSARPTIAEEPRPEWPTPGEVNYVLCLLACLATVPPPYSEGCKWFCSHLK
jgi:hypothetical protein